MEDHWWFIETLKQMVRGEQGMFGYFFVAIFTIIMLMVVYAIVKGVIYWIQVWKSPVESVSATVVSKRMNVSSHVAGGANASMTHTVSDTFYYITFETQMSTRMEFRVRGKVYGMISENDRGTLTYRGPRFLSFERV